MGKMIIKMDKQKKWTDEETQKLINNYGSMGTKIVELFPDRSKKSIYKKAESMNLKVTPSWKLPPPEDYNPGMIRNEIHMNEPVAVCLFGDWHVSAFTNEQKLFSWLEWLSENETVNHRGRQYTIKIILMGDLMENGLPQSMGLSHWKQKYGPQQQKEIVIDMIEKIKDKVIGVHAGNHEDRTTKVTEMEPIRDICNTTGVNQYGYGTHSVFKLSKKYKYSIYTFHGKSSAQFEHTKINSCIKADNSIEADVIGMGHVHHLASSPRRKFAEDGFKLKWYVLSGHFLQWVDTYAQKSLMTIGKDGAAMIYLKNNRWDIDVET